MLAADGNRIDLDCGIPYARIASWLDDELALPQKNGCWIYSVDGQVCQIALERLENRAHGIISLERTHLVAEGEPGAIVALDKLFILRFVSAGG
ncbi:MAG: hypothetical protein J5818_07020 [Eggerthellaceae bacterium]|nr:hypothetical protein [Eggerthellaceae bacterium]